MSGARRALLFAALLGLWSAALLVTVQTGRRLGGLELEAILASAASGGEGPRIAHLWPQADPSPLALGDELLALGGHDLRGAAAIEVRLAAGRWLADGGGRPLTARVRRGGELFDAPLRLSEGQFSWWSSLPFSIAGVLCVSLVLWRARRFPLAGRLFAAGTFVCTGFACVPHGVGWAALTGAATYILIFPLGLVLLVWVVAEFTASARPMRPWQRGLPLLLLPAFAACWVATIFLARELGIRPWFRINNLVSLSFCALILVSLTRAYRVSDAGEQRQLRWVIYGFYLGVLPFVLAEISWAAGLAKPWIMDLGRLGLAAAPIGVLVAVIGYRAFDVDRLIGMTASYTVVGLGAFAAAVFGIPKLSSWANAWTDLDPSVTQIAAAMLVGVLVHPSRNLIQPRLERRFLAHALAIEAGLSRLLDELPACPDVGSVTRTACERIEALFEPESVVCYARVEDGFAPIFASGAALPPAFPASGPLLAALEQLRSPVSAEGFSDRRSGLDPFERAALEALGAAMVAPIRRGDALVAFVTLGPQRSGDVYSTTHRALLAAACQAISAVLLRFDGEEALRHARALQEKLRRYVPQAVASTLEKGSTPQAGEQVVTILFVDVRDYVKLAEGLRADEIFATLDEHTERVSAGVRRHGGQVVEFHGDGLVAVFGAPEPLGEKECAAVSAALEILDSVGRASPGISIGMGIATGSAFVGNIRAADRWIWAVVGNPTNLAARLQALTRDLDAAIALDASTWQAARGICAGFEAHPAVRIRGRSEPVDVYALPRAH